MELKKYKKLLISSSAHKNNMLKVRIVTPVTFLHIHIRYYEMFVYKHTETNTIC